MLTDNDDRYNYFSKAAIATLPHLFWKPDVIICNDWQSAAVPLIYQQIYDKKDFYGKIKTVLTVHSVDEHSIFSRESYDKVGVKLPKNLKGDSINCYFIISTEFCCYYILAASSQNITKKLLELPLIKSNKKKLVSIKIDDDENPDFSITATALNDQLTEKPDISGSLFLII